MAEKIENIDKSFAIASGRDGLAWCDIRDFGVEGKGWTNTRRFYDRLPARAQAIVRPPVWDLSRHSAGMCVRFQTDSPAIFARWELLSPSLAMPHMPAVGVSGLDLYGLDQDRWRWAAVGIPSAQENSLGLLDEPVGQMRAYMLYLPLYNGVEKVHVGVRPGAVIRTYPREPRRPIVFYGTSILQGGCASRPGMAYTSILGRRLDRPTINLGFSGNGKFEPEVVELLSELDAQVFVMDALPNMSPDEVAQRAYPGIKLLHARHPSMPIVLVEDRTVCNAWLIARRRTEHAARRKHLTNVYRRLQDEGVGNLHYVTGPQLFGDDGEATVDGSHATDLGFQRMADVLEPVLRPLV